MPRFVIRFDDITPNMAWSKFKLFENYLLENKVKPVIGVVPDCRDQKLNVEDDIDDFWGKIRFWKDSGWTIAQHGYTHVYETTDPGVLKIKSNSEFSGLSYELQLDKILRGKSILEKNDVWQPVFMAPSHSFDGNTIRALRTAGFKYITDGYGLYPYFLDDILLVPQLFSKPLHLGFGCYTVCIHINSMTESQIKKSIKSLSKKKIISFDEAVLFNPSSYMISAGARLVTENGIKLLRILRN